MSREWMLAANHFDLAARTANKHNKPMTRPWLKKSERKGRTELSPKAARAALDRNAGRG